MISQKDYEVVSRVASNNTIVGFMVRPTNSSKEIYMSIDVMTFGLSTQAYNIKNVKLTSSGNPKGTNGFLLSKLPVVELIDINSAEKGLKSVLGYLLNEMVEDRDTKIYFSQGRIGVVAKYTATCKLNEYNKLEINLAQQELKKTLKFYHKNMPKQFRSMCSKIEGNVDEKGNTTIIVSKNLLASGKKNENEAV